MKDQQTYGKPYCTIFIVCTIISIISTPQQQHLGLLLSCWQIFKESNQLLLMNSLKFAWYMLWPVSLFTLLKQEGGVPTERIQLMGIWHPFHTIIAVKNQINNVSPHLTYYLSKNTKGGHWYPNTGVIMLPTQTMHKKTFGSKNPSKLS